MLVCKRVVSAPARSFAPQRQASAAAHGVRAIAGENLAPPQRSMRNYTGRAPHLVRRCVYHQHNPLVHRGLQHIHRKLIGVLLGSPPFPQTHFSAQ